MSALTPRSAAHHYGPSKNADHYVYRCYDADDRVVYIGCTRNIKTRLATHRRGKGGSRASQWLSVCMVRYEVEGPYPSRDAGLEAERRAIQAEQPIFNYQQRAGESFAAWMTRNLVADYLVNRGHVQLAIETCCRCGREYREAGIPDPLLCVAHEAVDIEAA